jgi:hypothetical protein
VTAEIKQLRTATGLVLYRENKAISARLGPMMFVISSDGQIVVKRVGREDDLVFPVRDARAFERELSALVYEAENWTDKLQGAGQMTAGEADGAGQALLTMKGGHRREARTWLMRRARFRGRKFCDSCRAEMQTGWVEKAHVPFEAHAPRICDACMETAVERGKLGLHAVGKTR